MRSTDLIRGLVEDEAGPWAIWWGKDIADADAYPDKSAAIFARLGAKLARELKPFGLASKTIRDGGVTFKGYEREPFEPVWERYLPVFPPVLGNSGHIGNTAARDVTAVTDVTDHRGETLDEQARYIHDWNADVYERAAEERARKSQTQRDAAPTEGPSDQQGLLGADS